MRLRQAKKLRDRVIRIWRQPNSPPVDDCVKLAGVAEDRLRRAVLRLAKWAGKYNNRVVWVGPKERRMVLRGPLKRGQR